VSIDPNWPATTGNTGRWPDERGTLNLLGPDTVLAAVGTVRHGRVVSCARALDVLDPPYFPAAASATFVHEMIGAGPTSHALGEISGASDQFSLQPHGIAVTHIDALSHFGFRGKGFNGHPYEDVATVADGAKLGAIDQVGPVVTRAMLADIPALLGQPYLEPGQPVTAEHLEAADTGLGTGDALVVRTGRWVSPPQQREPGDKYGRLSGLDDSAMDWIEAKDISLLATDGPGDNFPAVLPCCPRPVHVRCLAFLGIHLMHNLDLEELSSACAQLGQSQFLFVVAPLRIPHGTGSPVTPVAVL